MPYDIDSNISAFSPESSKDMATLEAFASDLCVTDEDLYAAGVDMSGAQAACLFDVRTGETLYSKNANKQLHPASLTKIMTALLALKYGNLDDILTVSENAEIKESGAQLCGFKAGDRLSLPFVHSLKIGVIVTFCIGVMGNVAAGNVLSDTVCRLLMADKRHFPGCDLRLPAIVVSHFRCPRKIGIPFL